MRKQTFLSHTSALSLFALGLCLPPAALAQGIGDMMDAPTAHIRLISDEPVTVKIQLYEKQTNRTDDADNWLDMYEGTEPTHFALQNDIVPAGSRIRLVLMKDATHGVISPIFDVPKTAGGKNLLFLYRGSRFSIHTISGEFDRNTWPGEALRVIGDCSVLDTDDSVYCFAAIALKDWKGYAVCDRATDAEERNRCRKTFAYHSPTLFLDVPASHAAADAVYMLKEHNVIKGYDDATFRPDQTIGRIELVSMLLYGQAFQGVYAAEYDSICVPEEQQRARRAPPFSDTPWASGDLAALACKAKLSDIIKGYPDGSFKPHQSVNAAEAAVLVARIFRIPVSDISQETWYLGAWEALVQRGAMPTSIRLPSQFLTRGEAAQIFASVLSRAQSSVSAASSAASSLPRGVPHLGDDPCEDSACLE